MVRPSRSRPVRRSRSNRPFPPASARRLKRISVQRHRERLAKAAKGTKDIRCFGTTTRASLEYMPENVEEKILGWLAYDAVMTPNPLREVTFIRSYGAIRCTSTALSSFAPGQMSAGAIEAGLGHGPASAHEMMFGAPPASAHEMMFGAPHGGLQIYVPQLEDFLYLGDEAPWPYPL